MHLPGLNGRTIGEMPGLNIGLMTPNVSRNEIRMIMGRAKQSKIEAMRESMLRSEAGKIPGWCLKSSHYNQLTKCQIYLLRQPITEEWEPLLISARYLAENCIPKPVQDKLDKWCLMWDLLHKARDFSPMSGDLSPITPDEKAIFGVRIMEPNRCFPVVYTGRSMRDRDRVYLNGDLY